MLQNIVLSLLTENNLLVEFSVMLLRLLVLLFRILSLFGMMTGLNISIGFLRINPLMLYFALIGSIILNFERGAGGIPSPRVAFSFSLPRRGIFPVRGDPGAQCWDKIGLPWVIDFFSLQLYFLIL